jgi:hypothetical protein
MRTLVLNLSFIYDSGRHFSLNPGKSFGMFTGNLIAIYSENNIINEF